MKLNILKNNPYFALMQYKVKLLFFRWELKENDEEKGNVEEHT